MEVAMSEKSGRSEEKEDFWGNKYTQHYDADGNKCGRSEEETDFWGNNYTQHRDEDNNKSGRSEEKEDIWGNKYTQNYDEEGNKSGLSEEKTSLFGSEYTQHHDQDNNKHGWSEEKTSLFGNKYTQHYDADGKRVDVAGSNDNDEDSGNTGSDENNNYSTHLNNYSSSKNESSSGKKIVWFILIFGIAITIFLIIRATNNKNQSTTVYKKTVSSQANKSVIESTGNQNKKPAPQAKLTKKMKKTPCFNIEHERERLLYGQNRDKIYYTVDDAKVRFLDNDSLEIRLKVDRVTINCTWSSSDNAYVGTWRRDIVESGRVSNGKIKLFPQFNPNNEIKSFNGDIMSYNVYISLIKTWSDGNDYPGTPISIEPSPIPFF